MKGILSSSVFDNFTSRCLGKLVARKRRRLHPELVEPKVNKKQKRVLAEEPPAVHVSTCPGPVEHQDTKAIVCLAKGQMLSLDGSAMVCLEEGSASMQGYSLTRGVETLVHSSSELCSALTFEGNCKLRFSSYNLEQSHDDFISFKLELFDESGGETRKRKMEWEEPERRIRPTLISSEWCAAADSLLNSPKLPVVPVCGVKGVGKSTFARYLVNKLLSRYEAVAYLDTDVGQPEFTIPGCLSLHYLKEPIVGPPASHMRVPERCFYYGDTSPKSDPGTYVSYFKCLIESFRESQTQIPLVINMPGWRSGAGYDILADVLLHATPTHVVEIEQERADVLPLTTDCPILHIGSVQCPEFLSGTKTAAELRALRVLSYFGTSSAGGSRFSVPPAFDEAAEGLALQTPYQVSADDFNILHLHTEVPASQCLYSLNAQLVGLGISSASSTNGKLVPCAGFGIIRGVDATKRLLEIITPCSPEVLENVDTLLHGRLDIPAGLLEVEGMDDCPYLCRNRILDGTGSSIIRRGHNILAAKP